MLVSMLACKNFVDVHSFEMLAIMLPNILISSAALANRNRIIAIGQSCTQNQNRKLETMGSLIEVYILNETVHCF